MLSPTRIISISHDSTIDAVTASYAVSIVSGAELSFLEERIVRTLGIVTMLSGYN
jgi:hypothetical protein